MRRCGFTGDIWPDEIQELLLRTALLPGNSSAEAWAEVRPRIEIDRLPGELHRLMPLLSKALTRTGIIEPELQRLKGVYQFSWYRNQVLFAEGASLIRALEAAGVAVMLIRGAAAAATYYGDTGLRPMNDLDLLVPPDHIDDARRTAEAEGWRTVDGSPTWQRRERAAAVCTDNGRVVRLHWTPSRNLPIADDLWQPMWQRAVQIPFLEAATMVPSAADFLVLACIDGARANSGSLLRWITDVTVLLRAADPDWDVVVSEARRYHVSLLVAEALRYLKTFDVRVPRDVNVALTTGHTKRRERLAHRLSLTTSPRAPSAAEVLGRFIRHTVDLPLAQALGTVPVFLGDVLAVKRRRDLPVAVAHKAVGAILRPRPSRASLSTAGAPVARGLHATQQRR
jgi:hypothetical protein